MPVNTQLEKMLIFNTTYLVSDKAYGAWQKWIHEHLIPFMLDSSYFSMPQVAKVIGGEQQDGTSFSVQFRVADMKTLQLWSSKYAVEFQRNCTKQFGEEVIFFTTVLEIVG